MKVTETGDKFAVAVGEALRAARSWESVTQDEVARRVRDAGINWQRATVAQVEKGSRELTCREFMALCAVLTGFSVHSVPSGVTMIRWARRRGDAVQRAALNTAEVQAARRLGVPPAALVESSMKLWGRSLTAERERRVLRDRHSLMNHAVRGHVTRALLGELRLAMADG